MSSMTRQNRDKMNNLLKVAPKSVPLTTKWLQDHSISRKLAWWYVKSGWFEHIAEGVYCFAEDKINWAGAIAALQQQLELPIYLGGKSALELLGKGHYISKEIQSIQLFAPPKTKSPLWIKANNWEASLILYRPTLFNQDNIEWLTELDVEGHSLKISSPEKASLELCFLVPKVVTFEEAALVLESLPRMRPKILQSLLESCQSYKVKRLLLFFGSYFEHGWINEINVKRIDLGRGKRVIAGGGHYDPKYQLSVPVLRNDYDNSEAL